jgi:hypothetical protein
MTKTDIFFSQHLCSPRDLIFGRNDQRNHGSSISSSFGKAFDEFFDLLHTQMNKFVQAQPNNRKTMTSKSHRQTFQISIFFSASFPWPEDITATKPLEGKKKMGGWAGEFGCERKKKFPRLRGFPEGLRRSSVSREKLAQNSGELYP